MTQLNLFRKKTCIVPTLWGWMILIIFIAGGMLFAVKTIHPFLATTQKVRADILVVEGWLPDYAIVSAIQEFKNNNYKLFLVTGGPLERGDYLREYKTYAAVGAATAKKMGLDSNKIVVVPSPYVKKDRTFTEAIALKTWLTTSATPFKTMNVFSIGCHSRRTHLLFCKVLGNSYSSGIISCQPEEYNFHTWWKSSSGVRNVLDETIAYFYALLFVCTKNPMTSDL